MAGSTIGFSLRNVPETPPTPTPSTPPAIAASTIRACISGDISKSFSGSAWAMVNASWTASVPASTRPPSMPCRAARANIFPATALPIPGRKRLIVASRPEEITAAGSAVDNSTSLSVLPPAICSWMFSPSVIGRVAAIPPPIPPMTPPTGPPTSVPPIAPIAPPIKGAAMPVTFSAAVS